MGKNLVIVESPAKAKTIEKFLGSEYSVKSCFGHIRDLSKNNLSIDIDKGFEPEYEIPPEKRKVITELKKALKDAEVVWLATDEDREGEAISWHLVQALNIDQGNARRIVFHEITKPAILEAIKNPRQIDNHLVDAQQARRVLDRLVGYEVSPILWRKIKPALSAGRVQSVAVRLIVEREEEIRSFRAESSFRITGLFRVAGQKEDVTLEAELAKRLKTREEATAFLEKCIGAEFQVSGVETKPARKSPAPPFTTSTLQQEASRKLGFSVAKTMMVAQQLYESGRITYMRTDSVHLSNLALATAKKVIAEKYGDNYIKTRQFTTRSKSAQEAHEAIRPTYLEQEMVTGDASQKRLYDLIWKRTIASQMSEAILEKTVAEISQSNSPELFIARGEVLRFEGFLKVYLESTDEEEGDTGSKMLPPLKQGDRLMRQLIRATERFSQSPARYTEASLVKKLEELGIGRPSTYAPIISTIQKREYAEKKDKEGSVRNYTQITLEGNRMDSEVKQERTGYEKGKLFPTDIGTVVNSFLMKYFENIMDYHFTAAVEKEFDEIAGGRKAWRDMIRSFYTPFHQKVKETMSVSGKQSGERLLGTDPVSGKKVYAKIGRYGPIVQIGESEGNEKPRFAGLQKGQSIEEISLGQALALFNLPRKAGSYEDAEITVAIGRFGPYVRHQGQFYSLGKQDDPYTISEERAIEIIEQKRKKDQERTIRQFEGEPPISILKGKYGPYISSGGKNYRIPKGSDPEGMTREECLDIISRGSKRKK
ncbi:MAG: type I DNA topoisomerase [Bacteroidales bacterium]|nr:type I DNA topoisomerase [Bacteroidales bacterium]